ncbi:MAG: hypothetical protein HZA04_05025 [Nitrospinae bacterium]|nr:hypothetical protein [Nitrospinota bacterium]
MTEENTTPAGGVDVQSRTGGTLPLHRSLHTIISEEEFLKPLEETSLPFFRLALLPTIDKRIFNNRFYFNLMNEAEKLEVFLDDHGAKENRTWVYFRELVASIRNFAIAAFQLSHLLSRYHDYHPAEPEHSTEEFLAHGEEAMEYINGIVTALAGEAVEELKRRGCDIGMPSLAPGGFKEIVSRAKLPRNMETEVYKTSDRMIMHIVESYRKVAVRVNRERYGKKTPAEEFAKLIPARINETKVKILESALHNIQSEYDTHIRQTREEMGDPDLVSLRAFISAPMHLFEMARWLIHFYERHENDIHSDQSRDRIAGLVDKKIVLGLISDFGLFYAHRYMMMGKSVSEKVMTRLSRITRISVPVPKPAGFHARPAYYVTLVVEEHGTDAFLVVGDRKFDARSVLDLLEAGGVTADEGLEMVEFEGDERTLADIKLLADCNYCENEQIPKELYYIRVARNIMT